MLNFTKTLAAIALGATVIGGVTWAATGLGGLDMSLSPPSAAWHGYSNQWESASGPCVSNMDVIQAKLIALEPGSNNWVMYPGQKIVEIGTVIEQQSTGDGWNSMALAGCHGWASPFLNAGKIRHADSFDRRFVGVQVSRLLITP
jgi:hypothetical protein